MFTQKLMPRWIAAAAVLGGLAALVGPGTAQARVVASKRGSSASRPVVRAAAPRGNHYKPVVPAMAKGAKRHRFHSTYWDSTQTQNVLIAESGDSSGGDNGDSSPRYVPTPWEQMALYGAMLQQQQMLLEQQRRQERCARCEKQRQSLAAQREKIYQQNRKKAQFSHKHDDPEKRRERYLASAAKCEREGDVQSAAAYYRLAARCVPDASAAAKAAEALARLGAE